MATFRLLIAGLCLASAGCSDDQPRSSMPDDVAVAKAEALSKPPPIALRPEEITMADLDAKDLYGASCYFLDSNSEGNSGTPPMLFLAMDGKGWLKIEGKLEELSAEAASSPLPYENRTKYIGLSRTLALKRDEALVKPSGDETEAGPGEMVVKDSSDEVVFRGSGQIECGA